MFKGEKKKSVEQREKQEKKIERVLESDFRGVYMLNNIFATPRYLWFQK